ncbi:unnamed protein product [Chilo suppressalis]|uniref:C-type lectin domain-containing protein n=1 Tax=Chilo suppressalis TaxID=168631 RepID=A0ABN8AVM3_CHISP|nr:unnamed protein product [Chilo suppressalis]
MFYQLCYFLFGLAVVSARRVNFYRKDYVYFEDYDAFYKLHGVNLSTWNLSFLTCDDEGAELFYPATDNEWEVASKLAQVTPIEDEIFVGIHDKFVLGEYVTINGRPTNVTIENTDNILQEPHCVAMNIRTGAYRVIECDDSGPSRTTEVLPFICKKVEEVTCPTIDKGYKYVKETRKCYKINENRKTWSKAMETCFMEGGMLVVIESTMESLILHDLINDNTKHNDEIEKYHAGFKKFYPLEDFYTIKGHKLQDSGYNDWYPGNNDNERCGAVLKLNSKLYLDMNECDTLLYPFVCEIGVIA